VFLNLSFKPQAPSVSRRSLSILIGILALAVAVRVTTAVRSPAISKDGTRYLSDSQGFTENPLGFVGEGQELPFIPVSIALIRPLLSGFSFQSEAYALAAAGRTVSIVAGVWMVLMIFLITRRLFDSRTGIWAAIFASLMDQFVVYSADVVSDIVFVSLELTGLLLLIEAFGRPAIGRFVLVGLAGSICYLTRREGLLLLCAAGAVLLFYKGYGWRRRGVHLVAVLIGFAPLAVPFMWKIGGISPPADDNIYRFLESASTPSLTPPLAMAASSGERIGRLGEFGRTFLEKWAKSLRYLLAAFFLMWFVPPRSSRAAVGPAWVLAILAAGHVAILLLFFQLWQILSIRYVLPLTALSLPWVASGFIKLSGFVASGRRGEGHQIPSDAKIAVQFRTAVLAAVAGIFSFYIYRGNNPGTEWITETAEWISESTPANARFLVTDVRIGFYSDRASINSDQLWPPDKRVPRLPSLETILATAWSEKIDYFAGSIRRLKWDADGDNLLLQLEASPAFQPVFATQGRTLGIVYKVGGTGPRLE
jgi:4-amino-4-deoxy-L-arabinose transferase-like glycosyltransferase